MADILIKDSLSIVEQDTLSKLEDVIEKNLSAFYEVGSSLMKIRDGRLYRESHRTFEEYCKERWQIARRTAYQFIDSVKVIENVRNCAQTEILPTRESQTRLLAHLEPKQQREVWQRVVETAPKGKITAKHVENTVHEMIEGRKGDSTKAESSKKEKNKQKSLDLKAKKLEKSKTLGKLRYYWSIADDDERKEFKQWIKKEGN
jgi:hypothetical protein